MLSILGFDLSLKEHDEVPKHECRIVEYHHAIDITMAKKPAKFQKDKEKHETERFSNVDRFRVGELEKGEDQRTRSELTRKVERLDKQIAETEA